MEKNVFKKLFTTAWMMLVLACCQLAAAAPTVTVSATPNNPTAPASVTLAIAATTDGDPVMATEVEYFNGATSLGIALQSPFTLTLDNVAAGTYQISAKVTTTDPLNPILQSAPLAVTVGTAPGAATAYFIHTDQLDTPRAITNASGNVVWQWDSDPFGKDAANEQPAGQPAFTFNQRFPGQQFDRESNLHYNYFRDYDPSQGRYVESDPIGLKGGVNTFGYVGGNPTGTYDPRGLAAAGRLLGAQIGGWAAGIAGAETGPLDVVFIAGGRYAGGIAGSAIEDYFFADQNTSVPRTKEDEAQRVWERQQYHKRCDEPEPPNLTNCQKWKWRRNRAQQCVAERERYSQKWYPGSTEPGHETVVANLRQAIENLDDKIRRFCAKECP